MTKKKLTPSDDEYNKTMLLIDLHKTYLGRKGAGSRFEQDGSYRDDSRELHVGCL